MSQRVSRVVIAGEPGRVTVDGEIVRHLVNVGPPGPAGPPGAGARIDGVVDTVGELPVAADPGSIWIVRPDMMHMWDEVDGWQAVGQVSVVSGPEGPKGDTGPPPQINDLPTRPGGPQPTDEIWLASAGGAADFKANFNAILAFIAGSMATTELNPSGGSMLKLPHLGLELAVHWVNAGSLSAGQVTEVVWDFPAAFGNVPHVFALSRRGGAAFPRQIDAFAASSTSVTFRVEDLRSSGGAQTATFDALAIRIG